jgi:hypothetical protein
MMYFLGGTYIEYSFLFYTFSPLSSEGIPFLSYTRICFSKFIITQQDHKLGIVGQLLNEPASQLFSELTS